MKWMIAGLVWGMCWSCFSAEVYRTFTDEEGRTIRAKVVKFDPRSGKVTIERDTRRKVTVSASIFSEADQTYIKEWLSVQDFMSNNKLRISIVKKQGKRTDTKNKTRRTKPPAYYEIQLISNAGASFDEITIEYCMYVNKDKAKGKDTLSVVSVRRQNIQLVAQKKHVEKTKVMELYRYYDLVVEYGIAGSEPSYSYNKTAEDDLKGIWVRVFLIMPSGNEFMREICDPSSIAKKYEWKKP